MRRLRVGGQRHPSSSSMPIASGSFLRTLRIPCKGSKAARTARLAVFRINPLECFSNFFASAWALCRIGFIRVECRSGRRIRPIPCWLFAHSRLLWRLESRRIGDVPRLIGWCLLPHRRPERRRNGRRVRLVYVFAHEPVFLGGFNQSLQFPHGNLCLLDQPG